MKYLNYCKAWLFGKAYFFFFKELYLRQKSHCKERSPDLLLKDTLHIIYISVDRKVKTMKSVKNVWLLTRARKTLWGVKIKMSFFFHIFCCLYTNLRNKY